MLTVKNLFPFVLSLGLFLPTSAQGLDTTDYFPLHVGDTWWTIGLGGGYWGPGGYEITGMITIGDTAYFVMDSVALYRKDSAGSVYQRLNGIDQLYYKVTATEGEKWPVDPEGTMEMSLLVASEDLTTPVGWFTNCKVFMLKPASGGFDNDFFYTLAPGIGLIAYDSNPITDEHWRVRRALISGVLVRSPLHIDGVYPGPNEGNVDTAGVITFDFDSFVDTNIVSNKVKVLSRKAGLIAGSLASFSYGTGESRRFAFFPSEGLLPMDTVIVTISAEATDVFGEGLDGNGNGRYEGSPVDDYSWTFYTRIVTGVEDPVLEKVPMSFSLSQNYPNPFNPSTIIPYTIGGLTDGSPVSVRLVVYNILGQEVNTLVEGLRQPGTYKVTWDGTDNSGKRATSGVYLYRLVVRGYVSAKTMVLVR
jgi:hypothetical protein